MNVVKYDVKYSMNECINNKKIVYLRNNDIYIYEKGRLGRSETPGTCQRPERFERFLCFE